MASWGFGRIGALVRDFERTHQLGAQALKEGRLLDAERFCEESVSVVRMLATSRPADLTARYWLATSLANQAEVLRRMGANPETEPLLRESAELLRSIADRNPGSVETEAALAMMLLELAKSYRGQEAYVDFGRSPMFSVEEMRAYRRERLDEGTWRGSLPGSFSPEWRRRAEAPLLEAIPLLTRLARRDTTQFEALLALALNLLGEMYVTNERAREAIAPLQEAEVIYHRRTVAGESTYRELLADTRSLLNEALSASGEPSDRVGALEQLIPHLRVNAYVSPEEWRTGVRREKASARERYREALEELAELYQSDGREAESRAIWDGELGAMMIETLPIRRGD